MGDLESLTDKQLRAKCQQYGLPNVPVTSTSRKILIKKLIAAMDPQTSVKSAKRRDTENNDFKKKDTSVKSMNQALNNSKNNNSRRGRTLNDDSLNFIHEEPIVKKIPNQVVRKVRNQNISSTPIIVEDHMNLNKIDKQVLNTKMMPVNYVSMPEEPRLRRSVSLSKSGVVTTSYIQEIEPIQYRYDDEEDDPESEEDDGNEYDSGNEIPVIDLCNSNISKSIKSGTQSFNTSNAFTDSFAKRFNQTNANDINLSPQLNYMTTSSPLVKTSNVHKDTVNNKRHHGLSDYGRQTKATPEDTFNDSYETPYLSEFTRSLERSTNEAIKSFALNKSSPLQQKMTPHKYERSSETIEQQLPPQAYKRTTIYERPEKSFAHPSQIYEAPIQKLTKSPGTFQAPKSRRPLDDPVEPVRNFFDGLNERFHIYAILYGFGIFVVAAFIYSMLIP